jgi:hypothetical protein
MSKLQSPNICEYHCFLCLDQIKNSGFQFMKKENPEFLYHDCFMITIEQYSL